MTRRPEPADRDGIYQRIHAMVDSIPAGKVATYGQIAAEAGLPGRARLVGRALRDLPPRSALPWHRVLNAQGRISIRSTPTAAEQLRRLRNEGVPIDSHGRVDLSTAKWTPRW